MEETAELKTRMDLSTPEGMETLRLRHQEMKLTRKPLILEIVGENDENGESFEDPVVTRQQFKSLHLWCDWVAKTLNGAGLDMRRTLEADADIPWTKESVKEYLWRPVQIAMTTEESTLNSTRKQYPQICETITRHVAQVHGVTLPEWPDRMKQLQDAQSLKRN
jgi:hypothetical protein